MGMKKIIIFVVLFLAAQTCFASAKAGASISLFYCSSQFCRSPELVFTHQEKKIIRFDIRGQNYEMCSLEVDVEFDSASSRLFISNPKIVCGKNQCDTHTNGQIFGLDGKPGIHIKNGLLRKGNVGSFIFGEDFCPD